MKYSREYLERLAGNTGFQPDVLEKVLRLERALDQISRHPFLQGRLVLKGGTALNLFYARAPRLSVDLDFNYVGAVDREGMLRERPDIERAIRQLVTSEGYRVQVGSDEHAGRKFHLNYWNGLGVQDSVRIDVNYLFRIPLVAPVLRDAWTPDADAPCQARMAGFEEVMAGKLLAFLGRVASRDLYDVAVFAATPPEHDPALLRRLFIGLSGVLPRALTAYGSRQMEAFTPARLETELRPLLRQPGHIAFAALVGEAARLLPTLLNLSTEEAEYVERLQLGELRPELVAADQPELVARLRSHPALLWKVQNARRQRGW